MDRQTPPAQPLHPSIRDALDPEYVKLHDEVIQYLQPIESKPWDPLSRSRPSALAFGSQKEVEVGNVYDKDVDNFQVRVFTPAGNPSIKGWPCLVWYHGGGWVNGGLNSENGFLRHVCKYVQCVVVSVNYRHAPEYGYPTAANDCFSGLLWVLAEDNIKQLSIDPSHLAIGGLSAGGGLSAVVGLKAALTADLVTRPCFQLLICPVIDNTATISTTWSPSQHSPFLTPGRMEWYRQQYFKSDADRANWDASPCLAMAELLAQSPSSFIGIAECDLLAPEAIKYSLSLEKTGVTVEHKIYKGATHSVLVLAGIHDIGKRLVHDACKALACKLGTSYDEDEAPVLRKSH